MLLISETLNKLGVDINILSKGSHKSVLVECDYCQSINNVIYKNYIISKKKYQELNKDACVQCRSQKVVEYQKLTGSFNEINKQRVEKYKNTSLDKYGVDHPMKDPIIKNKTLSSLTPKKREVARQKARETYLEKHGYACAFENPVKRKEIRESFTKEDYQKIWAKARETCLERYGTEFPNQLPEITEKSHQTQRDKYGCLYTQTEEYKNKIAGKWENFTEEDKQRRKLKIQKTSKEKYGTEFPTQNPEVKKKIVKTRIERGLTKIFEGKTVKEWSDEVGVGRPYANLLLNKYGPDFVAKFQKNISNIELIIKDMLDRNDLQYSWNQFLNNKKIYRYDFLIENICLEADGLYFHSDFNAKPKNYHRDKRNFYIQNDIFPLFFRSDEIETKPHIVESILLNKLNLNRKKYFARNLEIKLVERDFAKKWFEANHLMGYGQGISIGLFDNEKLVCAAQIKRKKEHNWEISRFSTSLYTSIIGGYSKLIAFFEKKYKPESIITFVDLRYGSGEYLNKLGFTKQTEFLSFRWTDGRKSFHRMNFKNNSGYQHGLAKIWDCGQAKYLKNVNKN